MSYHDRISLNRSDEGKVEGLRVTSASLEDAKLLASLSDISTFQEHIQRKKRKLGFFKDIDDDILMCHEKMDEAPPKKRQVTQFRVSEGSPFQPYTRKTNSTSEQKILWSNFSKSSKKVSNDLLLDGVPCFGAACHPCTPLPVVVEHFVKGDNPWSTSRQPPLKSSFHNIAYCLPQSPSPIRVRRDKNRKSDRILTPINLTDIQHQRKRSRLDRPRPFKLLSKNFSWESCPELEEFLYLNLPQFINYNSNPKYTAHRQTLNQQLLDQFLWIADYHGYVFDQRDLTVTKLWSRIFEFFHIVAHQQQQQELEMDRSFRPRKSVSECIH